MSAQDSLIITVRNTFVHISSTRSARRSKTQPASRVGRVEPYHGLMQHRFVNSDIGGTALPQPLLVNSVIDNAESVADGTPSSPINLCREVTADGYSDTLPSHALEQQMHGNIRAIYSDSCGICAIAQPSYANPQNVAAMSLEMANLVTSPSCCEVLGVETDVAPPSPAALCRDVTADGFEVSSFQATMPTMQCVESERFVPQSRRRSRPPRPPSGPPPQTLVRSCMESGKVAFRWAVDAKKLRGSDQLAVSPPFDMQLGSRPLTFRLMAAAAARGPPGSGRGGGTFRSSKGRGTLRLKCETADDATMSKLMFRFSIGPGTLEDEAHSEVLEHDFALNGICTCKDEWDFTKVVDECNQVFYVRLEV